MRRGRGKRSIWTFTIHGPLLGYRASARRAFDPRYRAWKQAVRLLADATGVPDEVTQGMQVMVTIQWRRRARIDGENVAKGIVDALFRQDRALEGGGWRRIEHAGEERADVVVSEGNWRDVVRGAKIDRGQPAGDLTSLMLSAERVTAREIERRRRGRRRRRDP